MKPLGQKCYGSIPHLPGSRLGVGDHHCAPGQAAIATERKRDKHDIIIVQEKLDGSNVGVAKLNGKIISLTRAGYTAESSNYPQHHYFAQWVRDSEERFYNLLNEGERVCGEWLLLAHGTRYDLTHEPFVPFDIIAGSERVIYNEFSQRVIKEGFTVPQLLSIGEPLPVSYMLELIKVSGHGAIDEVEGAIYRVERKGKVDFLCKYVHHNKQDGKYFSELTGTDPVWNADINVFKKQ